MAALALNKHIMSAAADAGAPVSMVLCNVFYNKQGLSRILQVSILHVRTGSASLTLVCRLQEVGIATEAVFSAFVQGLNAAHPLFVMTDVGPQKVRHASQLYPVATRAHRIALAGSSRRQV
jgi:hypothetical protein